jgi:hypothetical protein
MFAKLFLSSQILLQTKILLVHILIDAVEFGEDPNCQ